MNSLSMQAILAAGMAALVAAAAPGVLPFAIGALVAATALVAFAAQSKRLGDGERLVYRPVYARRHDVHRRIRSDD